VIEEFQFVIDRCVGRPTDFIDRKPLPGKPAKKFKLSTEFIYFRINFLKTFLRPAYPHKIFNDARTGYVFLLNALAEDPIH